MRLANARNSSAIFRVKTLIGKSPTKYILFGIDTRDGERTWNRRGNIPIISNDLRLARRLVIHEIKLNSGFSPPFGRSGQGHDPCPRRAARREYGLHPGGISARPSRPFEEVSVWVYIGDKLDSRDAHTPACSLVWSVGLSVSLIDMDMRSSWVSFCLPKATAPLVTMTHSRPSIWHSATCSTMDANRPRARPCSSSLVMTALPSLMTSRRAYFSSLRSANVCCRRGRSDVCSSLRTYPCTGPLFLKKRVEMRDLRERLPMNRTTGFVSQRWERLRDAVTSMRA